MNSCHLRNLMKNLIPVCIFIILTSAIFALPGDLDTTFGISGGHVISDFAAAQVDERPRDSAIQPDGKIVVVGTRESTIAGSFDFFVARFNVDGTLDTTFDGDGFITLDAGGQFDSANAVAIQTDGKIVVAGGIGESSSTASVFRLLANGTLDSSFDTDGVQTISSSGEALSMAIQTDGKIVLATTFNGGAFPAGAMTVLVRLNSNGSLDSTFDGDGRLIVSPNLWIPHGLALQTDGKIVAAGTSSTNEFSQNTALIRMNSDGTYDTSFDGNGVVNTVIPGEDSEARSLFIQTDGKILVGGGSESGGQDSPLLVRYNSDGSLDTSFDSDGIRSVDIANIPEDGFFHEVVQQSDSKIVTIYSNKTDTFPFPIRDDFYVFRFNADGSNDNSFDTNSFTKSQLCEDGSELALQTDGKIIAVGSRDRSNDTNFDHGICVQRFNTDGAVDYAFNSTPSDGKLRLEGFGLTEITAVAGLPNGKIIIAGWNNYANADLFDAVLMRLNANGSLDTSFMDEGFYIRTGNSTTSPYYFYDLKVQTDGSFFAAGEAGTLGGMLVKFNSANVPDTTFSGDGVATSTFASRFYALAVQSDGKIIGCGSTGATIRSGRIARFSATGSFEASAVNNLGASVNNNEILECGLQSDGKVIVAGFGLNPMLNSEFIGIGRHQTNLSADTTFGLSGVTTTDMSSTLNDRATDLVIQSDNKIVVSSTGFNTDRDFAVLRYDANGTLDSNFTEHFGTGGTALIDFTVGNPNDEANALLIQPDGQFIVGGSSNAGVGERFGVAKVNGNGSLALGWGTLGRTLSVFPNNDARIKALGFYLSDKILAAGRTWNGTDFDFAVARYQNESIPTAANVSVSGKVLTSNGNGIRNVVVTLVAPNGTVFTADTGSFGYFRFESIPVGESYVMSVFSKRFAFKNPSQLITVNEDISNIEFVGIEDSEIKVDQNK